MVHTDWMSPLLLPIALPAALVVFIVNMMAIAPARELNRRIAEREQRQHELHAPGFDEGGFNYFEVEQQWKLWRRDYRRFGDAQLNVLGDKAFKRAVLLSMFNFACIFVLVYALSTWQ